MIEEIQGKQPSSGLRWSPDILKAVGRLDLVAHEVLDGVRQGLHRSVRRGFSSEFFDYKAYGDGDDAARIDWRLYAKTSKFFIKRFEAETSLEVMLLCDFSPSMRWAWQNAVSKLEYAGILCASLASLFQAQRDVVGFHSFGDGSSRHIPARAAGRQNEAILAMLSRPPDAFDPQKRKEPFSLTEIARGVKSILPHRGLLIVVSDYELDEQDFRPAFSMFSSMGNEMIVIHLLDYFELSLPFDTATHLRDSETGELLPVHLPRLRDSHERRIREFRDRIRSCTEDAGGVYVPVNTADTPVEAILRMLSARKRGGGPR